MTAPLSQDALEYLGEVCGDKNAPRIPDGRRHHDAVQELLAAGFVEYKPVAPDSTLTFQAVTEVGCVHYFTHYLKR